MLGLLLFFIAYILFLPLTIINFFVVWDKGYFKSTAISLDKFANREFRSMWNKYLRTEKGYKFGKENETISSALGKNERDNTLTKIGDVLCWVLNKLDKNHCKKSIMEENLVLGRKATLEEIEVIKDVIAQLDTIGLELIGTRPKDR